MEIGATLREITLTAAVNVRTAPRISDLFGHKVSTGNTTPHINTLKNKQKQK